MFTLLHATKNINPLENESFIAAAAAFPVTRAASETRENPSCASHRATSDNNRAAHDTNFTDTQQCLFYAPLNQSDSLPTLVHTRWCVRSA